MHHHARKRFSASLGIQEAPVAVAVAIAAVACPSWLSTFPSKLAMAKLETRFFAPIFLHQPPSTPPAFCLTCKRKPQRKRTAKGPQTALPPKIPWRDVRRVGSCGAADAPISRRSVLLLTYPSRVRGALLCEDFVLPFGVCFCHSLRRRPVGPFRLIAARSLPQQRLHGWCHRRE
jgi:hypothetical protein